MLRKRAIKISVRLNEQEHEHLKKQAAISGYPMEPFIRAVNARGFATKEEIAVITAA